MLTSNSSSSLATCCEVNSCLCRDILLKWMSASNNELSETRRKKKKSLILCYSYQVCHYSDVNVLIISHHFFPITGLRHLIIAQDCLSGKEDESWLCTKGPPEPPRHWILPPARSMTLILFGDISDLLTAGLKLGCFPNWSTIKGQIEWLSSSLGWCMPTYLPSLDVHIWEGVFPPVFPKWPFLLSLDGLGVIILINPHLR